MTTETSTTSTLAPNLFPKSTGSRRPQTFPYATVFPGTNTTNFHFGNRSTGSTVSNHTVGPVLRSPAISHINVTSNSSSWVPHFGTNSSSAAPTTVEGNHNAKSNGSTSAPVFPTQTTQMPTEGGLNPSAVQLLVRVPLSFRIINRSFNESLRDPVSAEYRSLSRTVLTMSTCTCRRKSRGKLDLLSQKDSYHPMAEYLQYQSHGRYVAGSSTTRAGTFTYTNPASGSDNL
uniref:SEA domain-containing protein n=1 Tax=Malurus cyaneus samueli TaxID=2593467 RepID=A0A8C5TUL5_9PASS